MKLNLIFVCEQIDVIEVDGTYYGTFMNFLVLGDFCSLKAYR